VFVIPTGTVGTVVFAGENYVDVSFDRVQDQDRLKVTALRFAAPVSGAYAGRPILVFDAPEGMVVAAQPTDAYRLVTDSWSTTPSLMPGGGRHDGWHGWLKYNKLPYEAVESSYAACLIVDAISDHQVEETRRVAGGIDVTEAERLPATAPSRPAPRAPSDAASPTAPQAPPPK
jgi:hypothetical protein